MSSVNRIAPLAAKLFLLGALTILGQRLARPDDEHDGGREKVLYVWAQDQAHVAPDFLAVVNFDEESSRYGTVIKTLPLPPPGNIGNEPHHCHLNSTKTILGCGGLLSLLRGQNGIFFFDVTDATNPRFLFSTKALESSITDDFLPLENGGFLITQMGAADGTAPGRVAEFDGRMHFVANHFGTMSMFQEWPAAPPLDGFNPHGISARPDLNLMMTADFILPASTLAGSPAPVLRGSVRIWDYRARKITKTVHLNSPDGGPALGTMDVKMLPKDPRGYGYAAGMFDGHIYLIDPVAGSGVAAFDCDTVTPHVDTPVTGGMGQLLATPGSGDRLIFGLFQAGQVGMLDTTDRANLRQLSVVSFGKDAGPHNLVLTSDDRRLVVADYFLNEDAAGIIHFEGDHKIHVLKVTHNTLEEDTRFRLDFNTAFRTGPARPHGLSMK
ncbi:MAG TPA: selenium-binding protein SBP56-related protein [Candidatus Acidoferrales bacterium]|nr:selenium-binding protein SBP56-related protein [Candidatus Acidoferrales bacterium]